MDSSSRDSKPFVDSESEYNNVHNRLELNDENQERKGKKRTRDVSKCHIKAILKHRVTSLAINLKNDNLTPKQDGRGRHTNRSNKIGEEIIAQVDERIRSFPRRRPHYSRHDNQKSFKKPSAKLSLTIEKLYVSYPLPIKQKILENVSSLTDKYVPKNDE
ncbi:hypothetical protein ILUMI_23495 [Ignelater luminosus]|uniref:Uncharacterized protein n=1 Tax=Ignelater luminosus TaxID=2038154 RepID=A0A8K0CCD3_IGNLU|nr:hypothetical protein ILUMI_23495 [Ignelater luminosus]